MKPAAIEAGLEALARSVRDTVTLSGKVAEIAAR